MSLTAALMALSPGARWSLDGERLAGLQWLDEAIERPTDAAIEAKAAELAAAAAIEPYRRAIQTHVDRTAQARGYDAGVTCASYAGSTQPAWAAEAEAFIAWRDAVWSYAYAELAKVQSGERDQPEVSELLVELPAMIWPS